MKKWKRLAASALALTMLLSLLPTAAFAAQEPVERGYMGPSAVEVEEVSRVDAQTSAGRQMLRALVGGTVELKDGNYPLWIDRLVLDDATFATDFYYALAAASDGDGVNDWLIDPTVANGASDLGGGTFAAKFVEATGQIQQPELLTATQVYDTEGGEEAKQAAVEAAKQTLNDQLSAAMSEASLDWAKSVQPYIYAVLTAFNRDYPHQVFWLGGRSSVMRSCQLQGYEYAVETDESAGTVTVSVAGGSVAYTATSLLLLQDADSQFDIRDTVRFPDAQSICTAIDEMWTQTAAILEAGQFSETTTDVEKIRYFNNWLTTHNEYNTDPSGDYPAFTRDPRTALNGRYGLDGPVCEGYSRAFKILCNGAGIPCILVDGIALTGSGSGPHMWNYVKVGDDWYGMDVTWNDPGGGESGPVSGLESENYLLVGAKTVQSGKEFLVSHPVENSMFANQTTFPNGPDLVERGYFEPGISAVTLDDAALNGTFTVGDAVPPVTVTGATVNGEETAEVTIAPIVVSYPGMTDAFGAEDTGVTLILTPPAGHYFTADAAAPEGWTKNTTASARSGYLVLTKDVVMTQPSLRYNATLSGGSTVCTYGDTLILNIAGLNEGGTPITEGSLILQAGSTVLYWDEDLTDGIELHCDTGKHKDALRIGSNDLTLYYQAVPGQAAEQVEVAGGLSMTLAKRPLNMAPASNIFKTYNGTNQFTLGQEELVTADVLADDALNLSAEVTTDSAFGDTVQITASTLTLEGDDAKWYAAGAVTGALEIRPIELSGSSFTLTPAQILKGSEDRMTLAVDIPGLDELHYPALTLEASAGTIGNVYVTGKNHSFDYTAPADAQTVTFTVELAEAGQGISLSSAVTKEISVVDGYGADITITSGESLTYGDTLELSVTGLGQTGEIILVSTNAGQGTSAEVNLGSTDQDTLHYYTLQKDLDIGVNVLSLYYTDGTRRVPIVNTAPGDGSLQVELQPRPVDITVKSGVSRVYTGQSTFQLGSGDVTLTGILEGDTLSLTALSVTTASPNVGAQAVTGGTASFSAPWYRAGTVGGTLTISSPPSSGNGGSSTPPTTTVPTSGGLQVSATLSGSKATVENVTLSQSGAPITMDFSALGGSPVTQVELPAKVVKQIAEGSTGTLEIVLADGASIRFDTSALKAHTAQAITVSIQKATPNQKQASAVQSRPAYEVSLSSGGKAIQLNTEITLRVPYSLQAGELPGGVTVWYVDENGNQEHCQSSYDKEKKQVTWKTDHLSLYMIGYDKTLANPFLDVTADAYYYDAVLWAMEQGITSGTSDTTFSPDAPCTRAQMATFLYRSEQAKGGGFKGDWMFQLPFTDTPEWAYEAIAWCYMNGITSGTSATTFGPDAPCTRAQMATFLYRYEQAKGGGFKGTWMFRLPFTDTPEWAYEAIAWCYKEGITSGTSDTAFSPDAPCTRAQMVTFLYRYFGK